MVSKCFRKAIHLFKKKDSMMKLTMYNNRLQIMTIGHVWHYPLSSCLSIEFKFSRKIISGEKY